MSTEEAALDQAPITVVTDQTSQPFPAAVPCKNYSNETLLSLLKRLKQIKPSIELDPEYEKFIKGKLFLENPSENTASSIEARLKAKGKSLYTLSRLKAIKFGKSRMLCQNMRFFLAPFGILSGMRGDVR